MQKKDKKIWLLFVSTAAPPACAACIADAPTNHDQDKPSRSAGRAERARACEVTHHQPNHRTRRTTAPKSQPLAALSGFPVETVRQPYVAVGPKRLLQTPWIGVSRDSIGCCYNEHQRHEQPCDFPPQSVCRADSVAAVARE
jgi:hypothetical protein